jgi:hypothetical protein
LAHNGLELSGRGIPDRYLFYTLTSYNIAMKSRSTPREADVSRYCRGDKEVVGSPE